MNKTISGRVMYKHLMPASVEVNLTSGKGFKLTAETPAKFETIAPFVEMICQDTLMTLDIADGQVVAVTNHDVADYLDLRGEFHYIGAAVLETTYKNVSATYQKFTERTELCGTMLSLFVKAGEKNVYRFSAGAETNLRLRKEFEKLAPGDRLVLSQAPDGKILNIVNQTQAREFSCR
mgnify:FL=1